MMSQPRRKKWTEAEERSLLDVYENMRCDGTLLKMKTREKKYRPIAQYVNSVHHTRDPVSYPWQWTWKDVSTKVQNMRHQYALVKQKIKTQDSNFDWLEGNSHWPNFLRYKEVFGDVPLAFNGSVDSAAAVVGVRNDCGFEGGGGGHEMDIVEFDPLGQVGEGDFVNGIENGVMDLEFDYDAEEGRDNCNGGNNDDKNYNKNEVCVREDDTRTTTIGFVGEENQPGSSNVRKKRKVLLRGMEKKHWGFLINQLGQLKEMENQFERHEVERERNRERMARARIEKEKEHEAKWEEMEKDGQAKESERSKLRRQWIREWEAVEREHEERENRRSEEELRREREWEERLDLRRLEWKKRMDETLGRHRTEMAQIQARILHDQQSMTNHFIGIVSQWTGHPSGLADHTGAGGHYLSQMMQNLHHVNGIHGDDERVEGDNQEDQFIVDG